MSATISQRPARARAALSLWIVVTCGAVAACSTPAADPRSTVDGSNQSSPPAATSGATAAPATVAALDGAGAAASGGGQPVTVTVYKSPTCGCCTSWVERMESHGYKVVVHDAEDVAPVKEQLGVPEKLTSCHTTTVGGYVLEGHVPPADIDRLLRERPAVIGLAVPGMPTGSPGMEVPGQAADKYDVVAFERGGATRVFVSH